jgi:hypothetical protein
VASKAQTEKFFMNIAKALIHRHIIFPIVNKWMNSRFKRIKKLEFVGLLPHHNG